MDLSRPAVPDGTAPGTGPGDGDRPRFGAGAIGRVGRSVSPGPSAGITAWPAGSTGADDSTVATVARSPTGTVRLPVTDRNSFADPVAGDHNAAVGEMRVVRRDARPERATTPA